MGHPANICKPDADARSAICLDGNHPAMWDGQAACSPTYLPFALRMRDTWRLYDFYSRALK
jgi:hypothetical protein